MLQILQPSDLAEELSMLYASGLPAGTRTGWPSVDDLYTVSPGYWTVVTGIPSDGKTTWLDGLMINLIRKGWKFVVYSPENQPHALHLANLCEKVLNRPFRKGYNNRMDPQGIAVAMDLLEPALRILRFDNGAIFPSLNMFQFACEDVLSDWTDCKVGVILDPWNELDHSPVDGMTETLMINWELMRYRQWIRAHEKQVHGFIVAHPTKPQRGKDGAFKDVTLYDISGSSAWKNKCDFGIIVRRREDCTVIDIEKCRWRHLGKVGTAFLTFNSGTGVYAEQESRNGRYGSDDEDNNSF